MSDTTTELTIRMAGPSDKLAICTLLQQAWHSAGGARWDQLDALGTGCAALVACRGSQTVGLCLFDLRVPSVARLSAVAVADHEQVTDIWQALWETAEPYLYKHGAQSAFYVGEAPWLLEALTEQGFQLVNRVISYEKIQDGPSIAGHPGVRLRLARPGDLRTVEEVDRTSFPLLWRYSRPLLEIALQPPSRLVVSELDRQIVGYQLSTQEASEGQIIRLAVRPDYRRQGIGSRLLADTLATFRRGRVRHVSLNTQSDNLPAQRLYERFGFQRTGEELPVLEKPLA